MPKFLTSEEVAQWEAQTGQTLYHVRDKTLGSILFGLPSEADYRSYKRDLNKAVITRSGDNFIAEKNLVSACLVHPTPKAFFEAVEKARQYGIVSRLASKIYDLASGEEVESDEGKEQS